MLARQLNQNSITITFLRKSWILLLLLLALAASAQAQTEKKSLVPVLQDYKGVKIGMTAAEVRAKLGKAQSEDKDGFLYVFSDSENAQIMLDEAQKVSTISVTYTAENQNPLKFQDVFGKNVEPDQQASGAISKLIRYTDAGYWISYNRTSGDKPVTILVIQKLK